MLQKTWWLKLVLSQSQCFRQSRVTDFMSLFKDLLSLYLFSVFVSSTGISLSRATGIHFIDFLKRFIWEKESKHGGHTREWWGEGPTEREKVPSKLRAEHRAGCGSNSPPWDQTWPKTKNRKLNRLCCPGAPTSLIFICYHLFIYLKNIYLILC